MKTAAHAPFLLVGMICLGSIFGVLTGADKEQPQAANLLQYAAAGHILGFGPGKVWVASRSHALQIELQGARSVIPVAQGQPQIGQPQPMQKVVYAEAWPGVTVEYDTAAGAIAKSTYRISAGQKGNPVNRIRLHYNQPVRLDAAGNLVIRFKHGEMREAAPKAWQMQGTVKQTVPVRFRIISAHEVGFTAAYDPHYQLVIDPTLSWSTFLGGSGEDECMAIAVDDSGNIYMAGYSSATWGSPVRAFGGTRDAFAAKLDSSGALLWNTFLGGSDSDTGYAIAMDGSGNVYVVGQSGASWGSPVTAFTSGYTNAFAAKLSSSGGLVWNTFLGWNNAARSVAVDGSGNLYAIGSGSGSWGTPVRAISGGMDVFVVKVSSNGTVAWNTFLGGSSSDLTASNSLAVDGSGNAYVAGYSYATWGSPVRGFSLTQDSFVAKLNSSGSLVWNTFLGGSGYDAAYSVALDGSGNTYVGGDSDASWGSPVQSYSGSYDVFAAKLNSNGSLIWNTFVGSSGGSDNNRAVAVDGSGNVYVGGRSASTWGMPVRAFTGGGYDAFTAKLNPNGILQWNTFLGGSGLDEGFSMTVDKSGNGFLGGYSSGTWGSPVRAFSSGYDAFAVKLTAPPLVSAVTPRDSLLSNSFRLLLQGEDLLNISAVKLVNAKTSQTMSGSSLDGGGNSLSAQFSPAGVSGLFNLVLTKAGLDYVFKTLFTVITPQTGWFQWQVTQLAKAGNTNTAGSLAVTDADRDQEVEVYAACGGQNLARLKQTGSTWSVTNFLDTAGESYRQLAVLDGNCDQELELYAASNRPQLYQYEWGKTTPGSDLGAAGGPVAVADGNHDGMLELYAASGNTTTGQGLLEWRWTGSTWISSTVKAVASGVVFTSVLAGDANHDSDGADEVYAAWQDGSNNTYFYQYQYNGSSWAAASITNPGSGAIKSMAMADLDQDGQNELYAASADGKIYQMRYATLGWSSTPVNTNSLASNQIIVGDADNNGQAEIYAAGADGHAWQFKYNGSAWQSADMGNAGTPLNAIAVGDGDNNFQFEVYALGADGYVYQFQEVTFVPTSTPTPLPTATPTPLPANTPTPAPTVPSGFGGQILDKNFFYVAPNPARGGIAHFKFFLRQSAEAEIRIYTPQGSHVLTKNARFYPQGWNTLDWNTAGMANGVYFYVAEAKANGIAEKLEIKKLVVVK